MQQVKRFFENDLFAKALGIEIVDVQPGRARARMTIREDHYNGLRIVHGGALFSLADLAFAVASNSHGRVAVAINATISFLKAVERGTLTAEAEEVACSARLATYVIHIRDDSGEVVAVFQGTVYRKKDSLTNDTPES